MGKSYLIETIQFFIVFKLFKNVAVTTSTGFLTFNINSIISHRLLQIPVEHGNTQLYRALNNNVLKIKSQAMIYGVLIIIDEIIIVFNITSTQNAQIIIIQ